MTVRWCDSFDWGSTLLNRYDRTGGGGPTGTNSITMTSGGRVAGSNRLRALTSAGANAATNNSVSQIWTSHQLAGPFSSFVVGFALKRDSAVFDGGNDTKNVFEFYDGSTIQLAIGNNSAFQMYVSYGASLANTIIAPIGGLGQISQSNWYYIECKATLSLTAGTIELRVNGNTVASVSGVRTINTTNPSWDNFLLGQQAGLHSWGSSAHTWSYDISYDDLYILDTTGAGPDNDFLGDQRVLSLKPVAAGAHSDFAQTGGTALQPWTAVDAEDAVNPDLTYISSSTVGAEHTFAFEDVPLTATQINAIQFLVMARKDDAGFRHLQAVERSGVTEHNIGDMGLGSTYSGSQAFPPMISELNPATGLPWTPAEFNAAEFGVRVSS